MKRKCVDQGPDLFAWADEQPEVSTDGENLEPVMLSIGARAECCDPAPVVDFLTKRATLPRRILNPPPPFLYLDRRIARKAGDMPPAPILPFPRRNRPPDPPAGDGHFGRTGT